MRTRLFSWAGCAGVLLSLAGLCLLAELAPARLDFSAGRVFSLSPATRRALEKLEGPLVVQVYFSSRLPPPFSLHERYLRDLLAEYRAAAPGKVSIEWQDPDGDEAARKRAAEAGVTPAQINTTGRDRFETREAWMGLVMLYGGKTKTLPIIDGPRGLEYSITRRVRRLVSAETAVVGFVTGHGEKSPDDKSLKPFFDAASDLVDARAVKLDKPVPPEVRALWVAGPSAKLTGAELDALRSFAKTGKPLVVLSNAKLANFADFQASPLDAGLGPLLADWGLSLGSGFVVDAQAERIQVEMPIGGLRAARLMEYPFLPVATKLAKHPALTGLGSVPFPFAQPVIGSAFVPLAESSHRSFLYTGADVAPSRSIEQLAKGQPGPFALAGYAEGPAGKLILVGTSYQLDPRISDKPSVAAFLLNLMEWSAQDEALLSVRGKGLEYRPLRPLDDASRAALKWAMLAALPLLTLGAAALRMQRRKARLDALPAAYADL